MALRLTEEEFARLAGRTTNPANSIMDKEKPTKTKYHNTPKTVNGIWFQSTGEAERYKDLKMLELAGKITGLTRQINLEIRVNNVHICDYRCDFLYYENGERIIEDYKGKKTELYLFKKALVEALYGIRIRETTKKDIRKR